MAQSKREAYIKACIQLHGLPYLWGGKGFSWEPYAGRDCSGFATERLHSVGGPDLRDGYNADKLHREFGFIPEANFVLAPGDLVFWGTMDGVATHVMVALGVGSLLIGSAGGDHTTVTQLIASQQQAKVMLWNGPGSMPGLIGYGRFPWLSTD